MRRMSFFIFATLLFSTAVAMALISWTRSSSFNRTLTVTSKKILSAETAALDCSGTQVEKIVCAANNFINRLTELQRDVAVLTYSKTNAVKWSNRPCGSQCRGGVQLSTLSTAQISYAKAVIKAAMGTLSGSGYNQAIQILAADDVLGTQQNEYSAGNYYIAFLGTPTTTGTWQLQFGGHHLAISLTYKAGAVIGESPFFIGLEPKTWTSEGTTYAPLKPNQSAMVSMLASLSISQLAAAKISASFSDVVLGPGKDGQFPTTKVGLKGNTLNAHQQALILAAIEHWVRNADDKTAASLLAIYGNEISDTYISYAGSATLSNKADYVRIDGPSIWIEFICQGGAVYPNDIHYHSVYRDHRRDYGNSFTF